MPKYKEIKKKLNKLGFILLRTSGSHEMWMHPLLDKPFIAVPRHGSKDLRPGTEKQILKDIEEVENALSNNIEEK